MAKKTVITCDHCNEIIDVKSTLITITEKASTGNPKSQPVLYSHINTRKDGNVKEYIMYYATYFCSWEHVIEGANGRMLIN